MKTSLFLNRWFHNKFMAARNWELVIYLFSTSATIAGGFENSRKLAFPILWLSSNVPIFLCFHSSRGGHGEPEENLLLQCFHCMFLQGEQPGPTAYLLHHSGSSFHLLCSLPPLFLPLFPSPTYIFFSILNVFIFNWRIIAWQYCVGFCHTSTWISHRYICPLPLETYSHLPSHATPLGCQRGMVWAPWVIQQIPTGSLSYIW